MMKNVFKPDDQTTFANGLKQLDSDAKDKYGKTFGLLKPEEKVAMVKVMDDELRNRTETPPTKPFYDLVKELTITVLTRSGATKI